MDNTGMKYNIFLEDVHNKDFKNVSNKIFNLEPEEKGILHTVAKNGPMALAGISKTTAILSEWYCSRHAAKRRIVGTTEIPGLIPNEFLIPRSHEKRMKGKDGKLFCLSTKGLFAALSTGMNLEQIYIYKEFMKFLRKQIARDFTNRPRPKQICDPSLMADLFEGFIKNRIHLFLIWHESAGINIAGIKTFQKYMADFYSKVDENFWSAFHNVEESREEHYKQLLQKNIILTKTIHALDEIAYYEHEIELPDGMCLFLSKKLQ